ncbi:hypothetical protein WJW27_004867 [Escherichia coli]
MSLLDTIEKDRSAIKRLKNLVLCIVNNVEKFEVQGRIGDISHTGIKSLKSDLLIHKEDKLLFVLSSDLLVASNGFNSVSTQDGSTGLYLSQGVQTNEHKCFSSRVQNPFKFNTEQATELLEASEEMLFQYKMIYTDFEIRCLYAVKHYVQEFKDLNYLLVRTNTKNIDILEDYISTVVSV